MPKHLRLIDVSWPKPESCVPNTRKLNNLIYIRPGRLSTFYWSVKWGNYLWNPHTQLAAHFSFNCLHHLLINSRNSIYFNAETTKFHSLFVLIGRLGGSVLLEPQECRNQFVLRLLFRLRQRDLCFYDFWHVQQEKKRGKLLLFHNCVFSQRARRLESFNF